MQHVVSSWRYQLFGRDGMKTWCGRTDWRGAGEHDPLCPTCARKAGLQPGSRENPVPRADNRGRDTR
jgi:hypothetical protein